MNEPRSRAPVERQVRREYAAKHCTLCRRYLPITDFYRSGARHHSYCKLCHWDRTRELRAMKVTHNAKLTSPPLDGLCKREIYEQ